MPKPKLTAALFVSVLTLGCASQQTVSMIPAAKEDVPEDERVHAMLIGTWLGEAPTADGGFRRSISRRDPDGQFEIEFHRTYPDGRVVVSKEVGFWGASGGVYFVLTIGWVKEGQFVPARRDSGYFDDAYRIIKLSSNRFEYQALPNGSRYINRRVPDDYDLSGS